MTLSREIRTTVPLLLCLTASIAFAVTAHAQTPVASPTAQLDWPSPDGKFAFVTTYGDDLHSIDLIDKQSGAKLQRIDEQDSTLVNWHVLWAPDSTRFALMTRSGHPIQGVDVYRQSGEAFKQIELPDLPEADIPEKLKRGKQLPHVANLNWQEAKQWNKDGSLVVTIDTMIDGAGGSITATRTFVLGFDRAGKATIVKSSIKYATERD
jgi:hypothetical protein